MHRLWTTQQWEQAEESEVIAALFNPPPFIEPTDMAAINKYHRGARTKYLNMFYGGSIPGAIKKIHQL